jgi:conjugal transfer pilus assembly protein TraK
MLVRIFAFSATLLVSQFTHALTELPTKPGVPASVEVSLDEYTLYSIKGGTIARLDGSGYVGNGDKDIGFGKAFIKPESMTPFTLFITSLDGRTFPVHVKPNKKLKGDEVQIKDVSLLKKVKSDSPSVMNEASSRSEMIAKMMSAMTERQAPTDFTVYEVGKVIPWWVESELVLERRYVFESLIGQVYKLKNISDKQMIIDHGEFYFDGAISSGITKKVIEPGQISYVYLIRNK